MVSYISFTKLGIQRIMLASIHSPLEASGRCLHQLNKNKSQKEEKRTIVRFEYQLSVEKKNTFLKRIICVSSLNTNTRGKRHQLYVPLIMHILRNRNWIVNQKTKSSCLHPILYPNIKWSIPWQFWFGKLVLKST